MIFTVAICAVLLALATMFVWGLVLGARALLSRGPSQRGLKPVPYLAAQTGCGVAVVVWAWCVWALLNLPSCL